MWRVLAWAIPFCVIVVGCGTQRADFGWVRAASRAELRTKDGALVGIADGTRLEHVEHFLLSCESGWERPFAGVPVAQMRVTFLKDNEVLGEVGVGGSFLTAGPAMMASRDISEAERTRLLAFFEGPPGGE